jgi:cytochrome c peroxidase
MSAVRACALMAAAFIGLCSCSQDTPYQWQLPPDFPPPRIPADNPLTRDKVELGRRLFYDRRLSANGTQACASCHQQTHAFSESTPVAIGSTGQQHPRNSMALVNVAYGTTYTWAHPGITTLEQHVLLPLFGDAPIEMGAAGHEAEILTRLRADEAYTELFARAFGRGRGRVSFDNVAKALASFVRTLISFDSPFDRYAYYGNDAALSESELRGMNLFMSERLECAHCHAGFNFSQFITHQNTTAVDTAFHMTGLYPDSPEFIRGADYGLSAVTGQREDRDRFKAPTLRNITASAPYMHDGSLATLNDVLDFYAAGGRIVTDGPRPGDARTHPGKSPFIKGFTLTEQERADLLAFLESLTDRSFLQDPRFSDPFQSGTSRQD